MTETFRDGPMYDAAMFRRPTAHDGALARRAALVGARSCSNRSASERSRSTSGKETMARPAGNRRLACVAALAATALAALASGCFDGGTKADAAAVSAAPPAERAISALGRLEPEHGIYYI